MAEDRSISIEVVYRGITFPPNSIVLVSAWHANRDGIEGAGADSFDIAAFTDFMRSLKAPPRGPVGASEARGASAFNSIGCAVCHVPTINTAPVGTVINQGAFTVPAALGDKAIHPFSEASTTAAAGSTRSTTPRRGL